MCTLVILRRPEHNWPVVIGANRDEMIDRPAKAPARHWPDRPEVVAGIDLLAGGSWLGVNDSGVAAAVLNRHGSLGPAAGVRSRATRARSARPRRRGRRRGRAVRSRPGRLSQLQPDCRRQPRCVLATPHRYRADRGASGAGRAVGHCRRRSRRAHDATATSCASALRGRHAARPDAGDWTAWEALLSDGTVPPGQPEDAALRFRTPRGFATVSSSLIALPAAPSPERRTVFRHAGWLPEQSPWRAVEVRRDTLL